MGWEATPGRPAKIVGTPNLLRPANIIRAILGKLQFPMKIGYNFKIGDYIHVQELHERQLQLMLEEVGFENVKIYPLYFGLTTVLNISLSNYPISGVGRTLAHFLLAIGHKPA